MTETNEVTPVSDFQKTAAAQTRRIEVIKKRPVGYSGDVPLYRGNRHEIESRTQAEYKRGKGGAVYTEINSGKANLAQTWDFNLRGELTSVRIHRRLNGHEVSLINLKRDVTGKFQIEEHRSSSGSMSSTLEKTWEEEFYHARQRTREINQHKSMIKSKFPLPQT